MQIQRDKILDDLVPIVEAQIEEALEERSKLGLSTQDDFEVDLAYYRGPYTGGMVQRRDGKNRLVINALALAARHFSEYFPEETKMLKSAAGYIHSYHLLGKALFVDPFESFPKLMDEDFLIPLLLNTKRKLKKYEKNLGSEGKSILEDMEKQKGRTYKKTKKTLMEKANDALLAAEFLVPSIIKVYSLVGSPVIRHELDHICFKASRIGRLYSKRKDANSRTNSEYEQATKRKNRRKKARLERELEQICLDETYSHLPFSDVLMETRALFFNVVPENEWETIDYDEVADKVDKTFCRKYVEEEFYLRGLDCLVDTDPFLANINRTTIDTRNYVYYEANRRINRPEAKQYAGFDKSKVNYAVASEILDKKLPEFQERLRENGRLAINAIAKAFKEDVTRFVKADTEAATFDEYLAICNG